MIGSTRDPNELSMDKFFQSELNRIRSYQIKYNNKIIIT